MGDAKKKHAFLIAVLLILAACSTQQHYRTLSFFFDGVPNPKEIKQAAIADSLSRITADTAVIAEAAKLDFLVHQPYRDKECATCHNQGRMGSLKQTQPGLCYQCHDNFNEQYTFEHGPAAGGFCTECHHPHKTKEEKLLKLTGQELCLNCHKAEQLYKSDFHDKTDESDCINCHNPHGSNNHSLLQLGTCTQCHDNFNEQYAVVHGPVESGLCSTCHTSHRSGTEKLLARTGQSLCYYCHDKVQVLKNTEHADIEDADCTECHNPHGGDDRFIFN